MTIGQATVGRVVAAGACAGASRDRAEHWPRTAQAPVGRVVAAGACAGASRDRAEHWPRTAQAPVGRGVAGGEGGRPQGVRTPATASEPPTPKASDGGPPGDD